MTCPICHGSHLIQAVGVVRRVTGEGERDSVRWDHAAIVPCFNCNKGELK
jgi:hypothetical protein